VPAKPAMRVADLPIHELLAQISSNAITPGSGVAGALALALAAACAYKAASITLKHAPETLELRSALVTLRVIASTALADGDRDSDAFEAVVHQKSSPAIDRLVCEEEQFADLVTTLVEVVDRIESQIQPNMAGDIFAARALATAAQQIQERNEGEALATR
jgi:hypothetical protein